MTAYPLAAETRPTDAHNRSSTASPTRLAIQPGFAQTRFNGSRFSDSAPSADDRGCSGSAREDVAVALARPSVINQSMLCTMASTLMTTSSYTSSLTADNFAKSVPAFSLEPAKPGIGICRRYPGRVPPVGSPERSSTLSRPCHVHMPAATRLPTRFAGWPAAGFIISATMAASTFFLIVQTCPRKPLAQLWPHMRSIAASGLMLLAAAQSS